MQKLIIGLKLDDKVVYMKTFEIQENSDKINKLVSVISVFAKHNLERGDSNAENESNS